MAKRRTRRSSARGWFSEFGRYVLLVAIAAITLFLVVLAFSRPAPSPSSTVRPEPSIETPSPTPSTTPTSAPVPSATPVSVVFLGDSYTVGSGATEPKLRWTTLLADNRGWTELNAGIADTGYGTAGTSPGALPYTGRVAEIVASTPAVVIVSGGRFDYMGSVSAVAVNSAIDATFTTLRAGLPEAQIIALNPFWDSSDSPTRLGEIAAVIQSAVESVGGTFVDVGQPLAGGNGLMATDGITPNDEGHAALYKSIESALAPLVEPS